MLTLTRPRVSSVSAPSGRRPGILKEAVETKLPARACPMEARLAGERIHAVRQHRVWTKLA